MSTQHEVDMLAEQIKLNIGWNNLKLACTGVEQLAALAKQQADPQEAVVSAALNLFGETASAGFCLPVPNTTPTVFVAAGEAQSIRALLPNASPSTPEATAVPGAVKIGELQHREGGYDTADEAMAAFARERKTP